MSEFLAEDVVNGQRVITTKNIDGTVQGNNATLAEVLVEVSTGVYQKCIAVKDMGGGSSGASSLSDLTDVSLDDIQNGQALVWNSVKQKWENSTILNGNIPVQITRNYKNIGGVTINDGLASGFAQTTKYLELPEAFNPSTSDWEMVFKFTTPNSLSSNLNPEGIFSVPNFYCLIFGFHTKLTVCASSDGTTWSASSTEDNGTTTLTTNTEYYLKATYESGVLTVYLSTDGETWTTEYTETIALAYTDSYKPILGLYRGLGNPNKGNIDLNESYIKIGGSVWWSGYSFKMIG